MSAVSAGAQVEIFLRAEKFQKKVRFSRAEVGSIEELSDDLGRFGHPKLMF